MLYMNRTSFFNWSLMRTDFCWEAYDHTTEMSAFGKNPIQALKRLKSKECKRLFKRHKDMRKVATHMTNGCWRGATGWDWEWEKIFRTEYGKSKR